MRLFFASIFAFASLSSFAVPRGWICRITLTAFESKAWTSASGAINYTAAFNSGAGSIKYYVCYWPNSSYPETSVSAPTLTDLGLVRYCDVNGNSPPQPPTSTYLYWLVTSMTYTPVLDTADLNPLGDLNNYHGLGPIYDSSLGVPYNVDGQGNYNGPNQSFPYQQVVPLQGDQGENSPIIWYDPNGVPHSGNNPPANAYRYIIDENGSYRLVAYPTDTGNNVDISPIVSGLQTANSTLSAANQQRAELMALLGSAGNSWVYDCKLSLSDLQSLASAISGKIDTGNNSLSAISSALSVGNSSLSSIASSSASVASDTATIKSKITTIEENVRKIEANRFPTLNTNITGFKNNMHNDLTALKTSVDSVNTSVDTVNTSVGSLTTANHNDLNSIKNVLDTINGKIADESSTTVPSLPAPVLTNEPTPDSELPFQLPQSFVSDATQTFNDLVSWGQSPSGNFHIFDPISNILQLMIGSIPSVGTDATMFSVNFNLPYIGNIQKTFSFSDYPAIPYFRTACLWALYIFFALACFKLIHSSII